MPVMEGCIRPGNADFKKIIENLRKCVMSKEEKKEPGSADQTKSSLSPMAEGAALQGARHRERELKDLDGLFFNVPLVATIPQSANTSILPWEDYLHKSSLITTEGCEP